MPPPRSPLSCRTLTEAIEHTELREQLELAIAAIQRLTLENHHLREQAEVAANVTRISPGQRARD